MIVPQDLAGLLQHVARLLRHHHDIALLADERFNPEASMTQAKRWWDFIGAAMVERGELSAKMAPFEHVFELGVQSA